MFVNLASFVEELVEICPIFTQCYWSLSNNNIPASLHKLLIVLCVDELVLTTHRSLNSL